MTDDPGPAGATVQLVIIDEFASFSMTVWPATSTLALTSRTRDFVACSFQRGDGACALAALEHLVVAVVRGQDLRAHGLVIRHRRQHDLR